MSEPAPGSTIGGYHVVSVRDVPEYESRGILCEHDKSGCRVYHLHNADEENLFSFNFKTPPADSKGTAHIIEHAVLSGSAAFPLKDPFVALMKGSMNTFLNAMTYPDKTIYPASSTVKRDFYNLMRVYGDAVFFPLLKREIFLQEGRRFQLDESENIDVQGVVYNEMQGNYSTHESIAGEWSYRSLFPDTAYAHDSGGMPEEIRELTYDEFVAFHRRYYHPSNCLVFVYGNVETEEVLRFLDRHFLSRFDRRTVDTSIPLQPPISSPFRMRKTSPLSEAETGERQTTITMNWLAGTIHDPEEVLALEVLSEILMGNAGSPLQKAVVESGLGDDLSPISGLDTHTLQMVFSVGLRGTDEDKCGDFEALVVDVLKQLVENGFPEDVVRGAVRRVEFRNRELRGGVPFGLRLLGKTLRGWLHGTAPETTLEFTPHMEALKRKAAEPGFLESMITDVILDNPHRSTVLVVPDPQHDAKVRSEFADWAASYAARLTDADRHAIRREMEEFRVFQETPDRQEDIDAVPALSLSDVPRSVERINTEETRVNGVPYYSLDVFTNGISYVDVAFDVGDIEGDLLMLLPLFCRAVTGGGLPGIPYDEVARRLALCTGGFSSFLETSSVVGSEGHRSTLIFRIKTLDSDLVEGVNLAARLILEADFDDRERMHDVLMELRNDARSQVLPSGHSFVSLRAASNLSPVLMRDEQWRGLDQLLYLTNLVDDSKLDACVNGLRRVREAVICSSRLIINVAADRNTLPELRRVITDTVGRLPEGTRSGEPGAVPPPRTHPGGAECFQVPATVGYVAAAVPAARITEPEHAPEVLLAHLLGTDVLWEQVRMRGGAYGVFASPNGGEGLFTFASYRDPNVTKTLDAYRMGLGHYAEHGADPKELEKAVIGVVGRDVRPMVPAEKAVVGFRRRLYNISDDLRQQKRDAILSAGPETIRGAAQRLLSRMNRSVSAVMAGKEAIEQAAAENPTLGERIIRLPL